jgi:Stealth protein CR2, conserved region 2/Stealth protein CR3, conserved region 3/Stealth protein CR4, conserved region 4/Stealth protein CR1, conserved region 1
LARKLTQLRLGAGWTRPGRRRWVRDGGRWVRASVVEQAEPLGSWQRHLETVSQVLKRGGVPYFAVRGSNELHGVLAVPARHKHEALRLLRAEPAMAGARVRFVDRRGRPVRPRQPGAVARVCWPVTNPAGTFVLGEDYACEVEFWPDLPDETGEAPPRIVAPRPNRVAESVTLHGHTVPVSAGRLTAFAPRDSSGPYFQTRAELAAVGPDEVTFPIDVVYTWVDGADPDWQARKNAALAATGKAPPNRLAVNPSRYLSRDELRYSLRSVFTFAPWVRHIYLVTDDQVPAWLEVGHPLITLVSHRDIFGSAGMLPTFNSHAIESRLHHISGLAEHFIYLNDDMFFGRPLLPTTFFHPNGVAKHFLSSALLDAGPPLPHEAPVNAAGKNNRQVIAARFGRRISQKMRHAPYALRRSVLEEIERELPEEVRAIASHQFRHPDDLSIASSLHHYWAALTGRSVPARIRYAYADLAQAGTPLQLAAILAGRSYDAFCLNDTDSADLLLAEQHAMLVDFLPAYFPFRAPFELPDDVAVDRSTYSATELANLSLGASSVRPVVDAVPSPRRPAPQPARPA